MQDKNIRKNLQKSIGLLTIFFLGLIPLLWLREGYIIAKGDYFPSSFNPLTTLNNDLYLWSSHNIGNVNPMGSALLYDTLGLFLRSLGLSVGSIQIIFQVFFFMGAGFSMYYLAKTAYPKLRLAPMISGIFYMFNFFVLKSRLNVGMAWTYVFIPTLMALLIRIVDTTYQRNRESTNKNIVYLALISTISLSFASVNPPNVIIAAGVLCVILLYYVIDQRESISQKLSAIGKLIAISIPLNLLWIIPVLNYYLLSPAQLNPDVSIGAWSWTHARASFLNLFWLNGGWDWRPEYFPYITSYSNAILILLTFVPLILAAAALFFKTDKPLFNSYLMLVVLLFIFLAKGLHDPLGQLNLLLYTDIPGMVMFREPASKFTMALMPFLALLVGCAVDNIANSNITKQKRHNVKKIALTIFVILIFIISVYPLTTNPIETETSQLPFSTYVKIPDYWYEAGNWLNNQTADFKILMTPPDDFYAMPYVWGYYGTDEFLTRFIQKSMLLTYYISYEMNPDVSTSLEYLGKTVADNKTAEFKCLLDLLGIKYILQRNDIQCNFTGRNIMSPDEMQAFLTQQPYIYLTKKFGLLDVYEYTDSKSSIYALDPAVLRQTAIKIEKLTTLERLWDFASPVETQEWQNATRPDQWLLNYTIIQDDDTLEAELWNSTWGWKTINSPLLPARHEDVYEIQIDIKGQNAQGVHIKVLEYDESKSIVGGTYAAFIGEGTFNWTHAKFEFEPTNKTTKYLQVQIWHGHETSQPFPNLVWVDNVQILGSTTILNATGLNLIFPNLTQNQPATILTYQRINPTKITATVNATQPFILAISEALDSSWTAYANGKQYKPIPLYLGLKGFQINETGLLDVVIEYEPQNWFYIGCAISLTTFLACTAYLAYSYTKTKHLLHKLKQKLTKKT